MAELNRAARESSRKKERPSKREGKKLVKRLRKGVSKKRVSKVKKRYSVSFSDKLGFRVASIDFPMYMLLQKKLGSSASKTNINEAEKVLYRSQQSLLPMFPVLAYFEHQNWSGAQGKAVKDLANLAGRAFYDMSDMKRRNILEIVGPNVVSVVDDREKFKIEEDKELFGTSVVNKLRKDGQFLSNINSRDLGKSRSRSVKDRLLLPPSPPSTAPTATTPPTPNRTTFVRTKTVPVCLINKVPPSRRDRTIFAVATVARRPTLPRRVLPTEPGSTRGMSIIYCTL